MQPVRSIGSIALIAVFFAGTASAQQIGASGAPVPRASPSASQAVPGSGSDNGAPPFSDLDKSGKGFITRGDVPKDIDALKPLRAHFNEADQNHDGRVDKAEYDAYVHKSTSPQR
ncbi:hypothetical protein GCM10009552_17580 [Rothia nasimurium]|uniref:EF-hand domain-containing protein n=1 Tax=Luteibacter anthropi TaxID=564369 RepID=A0A7X5U8Q8_9GAMM|nr:EF-hand domain-containing protein [Luteibacter anthropi]NII05875.1 EF-hand domain-containing protein [Luteibacter anthropi]